MSNPHSKDAGTPLAERKSAHLPGHCLSRLAAHPSATKPFESID
jgi:hypothetical protein